jgi:hypothetical protein
MTTVTVFGALPISREAYKQPRGDSRPGLPPSKLEAALAHEKFLQTMSSGGASINDVSFPSEPMLPSQEPAPCTILAQLARQECGRFARCQIGR